jgi:hypothetical protein
LRTGLAGTIFTAGLEHDPEKQGNGFPAKTMLKSNNWSGMTMRRKVITLQE